MASMGTDSGKSLPDVDEDEGVGSSSTVERKNSTDREQPTKPRSKQSVSEQPRRGEINDRIPASSPKLLSNPRWKRVVLKISGSVLIGSGPQNVDPTVFRVIAGEIAMAKHVGVEVAVVVGGRNLFCSESIAATITDREISHQTGMMASAMNSILLHRLLEGIGIEARVQIGFGMKEIAEPYTSQRAIHHLEKGRVVIFGGIRAGTGNTLVTTDTTAARRASEIHADALLKGTKEDAGAFEHISFRGLLRGYTKMDPTAITFCGENNISILIFNLLKNGNFSRALSGDQVGTLIDHSGRIR